MRIMGAACMQHGDFGASVSCELVESECLASVDATRVLARSAQ